jgi:hypothetical protein
VSRILLRHRRTGHYYNGNLEWVAVESDARDFKSIDTALTELADAQLDGMSLVLDYGRNRHQEFILEEPQPPAELVNRIKTAFEENNA